jgi:hypothetical protein
MKLKEIITAVKTVNDVKDFIKKQDEVKNQTLGLIEKVQKVRIALVNLVQTVDTQLDRLRGILDRKVDSNN